ncbi:hypothetical protein [Dyadobacter sp.]|uniref:hypothetical protein n=1 Tax=Dyadobacter sp. TaxID=1914288 RepID=UPI003F70D86C
MTSFVTGIACVVAGFITWDKLLHEKPVVRSEEAAASSKDIADAARFEARASIT